MIICSALHQPASHLAIQPHCLNKILKTGAGALIELHSEMMQMLLTMSHRIPTTYKGAVRGS